MRNLPETYKSLAYRSGRYPLIKIDVYEGDRKNWTDTVVDTITGSDHIMSAVYVNGTTTRPNRFETGIAYCGEFKADLSPEYYSKLSNSQKIKVYSGFRDINANSDVYIPIGVFFIESNELIGGITKIVARDLMMYAETIFDGFDLSYPCSLTELWKECIAQMGGKVEENFVLPVNVQVLSAPYVKTGMTFVNNDGKRFPGRPYTCRQVIAQIAKMQLGNAFMNSDGFVKISSYESISNISDNRIVDISITKDWYRNNVLIYQSNTELGEVEYIKDEEVFGTLIYNTFIPSENVDQGAAEEQLDNQFDKVKGWRYFGGKITSKGTGEVEIGDKIDYIGKYGEKTLFANGVIMEWSNSSFDETVYSFAPTYETSAYTSSNTESAPSDVENKADSSESSGGGESVTIENAIILTEETLPDFVHSYEVKYVGGNKIILAEQKTNIVVQGITAAHANYKTSGHTFTNLVLNGANSQTATATSLYEITVEVYSRTDTTTTFRVYVNGNQIASYLTYSFDDFGVVPVWSTIYNDKKDFAPYGYVYLEFYAKTKATSTADFGYQFISGPSRLYYPFISEDELNSAICLDTQENVMATVTETVTEV